MGTTIFREYTFEAAHRLPNVPDGHKCGVMHGHSYRVRLELRGEVDSRAGWFCDWGDADHWFEIRIHNFVDHHPLNIIPGLENPTCENLAAWIWKNLTGCVPGLARIVVNEGPRSGVVYEP